MKHCEEEAKTCALNLAAATAAAEAASNGLERAKADLRMKREQLTSLGSDQDLDPVINKMGDGVGGLCLEWESARVVRDTSSQFIITMINDHEI